MSIQPKRKVCVRCGNTRFIFSKGRCATCAALEQKSKKAGVPIKKVSKKGAQVKQDDKAVWEEIWNEREHYCEECVANLGKCYESYLGDNPRAYMFSHLLTKGAHPKLRFEKENLTLSCYRHHQQWEFGKRNEMKMYPEFQERIERLYKLEQEL